MGEPPAAPKQRSPRDPALRHGVLLTVAYDGARFHGAAVQKDLRTVGGELTGAIRELDPRASAVRICSRTDRGVHASGQLVTFDSTRDIDARGWVLGTRAHLPDEIAVVRARRVPLGWDARGHAIGKVYRYRVLRSVVDDPLWARRAWRMGAKLDTRRMRSEAALLLGCHDFAAFRAKADERTDTVRTLRRADLLEHPADARVLELVVHGDRFLYNMVRIIAGTLVDVGRGALEPGAVERALASKDRSELGMTAPPDGLLLESIELDEPLEQPCWPAPASSIAREEGPQRSSAG